MRNLAYQENANEIIKSLNPQQKAVLAETRNEDSFISSGPGSGKSRVIIARTIDLIESGINPKDICLVTFTNKAAASLVGRLKGVYPNSIVRKITVGTFHKISLDILRGYGDRIGLAKFSIIDEEDSKKIIKDLINEYVSQGDQKEQTVRFFKNKISDLKNNLISPSKFQAGIQIGVPEENLNRNIYNIYDNYQRQCWKHKLIDFDDMMFYCYILLRRHKDVREQVQFKYISVDECQDTNMLQLRLTDMLTNNNKMFVGDTDQSIYGWRNAKPDYFVEYSGKVMNLGQNYRSTKTIVNAAESLIRHNTKRVELNCFTTNAPGEKIKSSSYATPIEEAKNVALNIHNIISKGNQPKDIAILFRTNKQNIEVENALRALQVPYTIVGGISFFNRKEIKDILAYMKLYINKKDNISVERIFNNAPGVGKTMVNNLKHYAAQSNLSLLRAAVKYSKPTKGLDACLREVRAICEAELTPSEFINYVLANTEYGKDLINSDDDKDSDRLLNINTLMDFAKEYEKEINDPTVEDFILSLNLAIEPEDDPDTDTVKVMTLHSSKGLEFAHVFLIGCNDGLLPHAFALQASEDELEEERRLFYVGMTRAEKYLYLTRSRNTFNTAKKAYVRIPPSRFLNEIDPAYVTNIEVGV